MAKTLLCPSAQPNISGATAFGVIGSNGGIPTVNYLSEELAVTGDLLRMCQPVSPTEVFRFAAPCQGTKCQHFDGQDCRLVGNLVQIAPARKDLPHCSIRPNCRWFAQQGDASCAVCPDIITTYYHPPAELDRAAVPFLQAESA